MKLLTKKSLVLSACLLANLSLCVSFCSAKTDFPSNLDHHETGRELLPLPLNSPREILNPYHAKSSWKLWAQDASPISVDVPSIKDLIQLPAKDMRVIPVIQARPEQGLTFRLLGTSSAAGLYDDVYLSLDKGHSNLWYPPGQYFINAGSMAHEYDHQTRFKLGVNFTSQSYADRGRAIVDDTINNLMTEKFFFFANSVRATPGYDSYSDSGEGGVKDNYDGLHAHSLHALGQSKSEVYALSKMMIAGAAMPRPIKDLLKKHGAYASCLLTIFKAALPYADDSGIPLPYEHELRHRPVYSSHGDPLHKHYCASNLYYHGYDDARHLWEMARMAGNMEFAPPVALLGIAGIRIQTSDGTYLPKIETQKRIKSSNLTSVRIWGEPEEMVEVLIDLRTSYDLQGQALHYHCQGVYPNQKNVEVKPRENGVYAVRVSYDNSLPKGRIPVICTARNSGSVPSNPVFLNFYWSDDNELSDYGSRNAGAAKKDQASLKKFPVTLNKRPHVSMRLIGDSIPCMPGDSIVVPFEMNDPEGFPVTIYRWLDEWGTIEDNTYRVNIPADAKPHIRNVHFIFSDGTGGYSSRLLKLCIGKSADELAAPWASSQMGHGSLNSSVRSHDDTLVFQGHPAITGEAELDGLFAFHRTKSKDFDIMAQIREDDPALSLGLLLTNALDQHSRRAYVGLRNGKVFGLLRPQEREWGSQAAFMDDAVVEPEPSYFRIISRDGLSTLMVSVDGEQWLQIADVPVNWFENVYSGLLYGGSKKPVTSRFMIPDTPLPQLSTGKSRRGKDGSYTAPLKIKAHIPLGYTARYTTDGSLPHLDSPLLGTEIELTQDGEYLVRVSTYKDESQVGLVSVKFRLVKKD